MAPIEAKPLEQEHVGGGERIHGCVFADAN
jgi:hypothetical protein